MDGSVFFSAILAASVLIGLGVLWRRLHITQTATGSSKGTAKLFAVSLAVLGLVYTVSKSFVAFAFAPEIIVGAVFSISAFFFIGQLR